MYIKFIAYLLFNIILADVSFAQEVSISYDPNQKKQPAPRPSKNANRISRQARQLVQQFTNQLRKKRAAEKAAQEAARQAEINEVIELRHIAMVRGIRSVENEIKIVQASMSEYSYRQKADDEKITSLRAYTDRTIEKIKANGASRVLEAKAFAEAFLKAREKKKDIIVTVEIEASASSLPVVTNGLGSNEQIMAAYWSDRELIETAKKTEAEVKVISQSAGELLSLPHVNSQFEQEVSQYLKEQLAISETLSHQAVDLAQDGASAHTVKLIGDFAYDVVSSTNQLLQGAANGIYDNFLTTAQVMEAIYRNPALISHLTENVLNYLKSGEVLSSVNQGVAYATSLEFIADIKNSFIWYYVHAKSAPPTQLAYELGHAEGELGANILLAMAGTEVTQGGKLALQKLSGTAVEKGIASDLGVGIINWVREPKTLAPALQSVDLAASEVAVSLELSEKYTIINFEGTTKIAGEVKDISRRVYQRNDINWKQVDPDTQLTNRELIKEGKSPYWQDGFRVELHHIIQQEVGPIVEIPANLHQKYFSQLHGLIKDGESFRNDPKLKKQYSNFRVQYWKKRWEQLKDNL